MKARFAATAAGFLLASGLAVSGAAWAQPVDREIPAATTTTYPPGVHIGKAGGVAVYVDQAGRTLYGMDMRTLVRATTRPLEFCKDACAARWEPLLAPGAAPTMAFSNFRGPSVIEAAAPGGAAAKANDTAGRDTAPAIPDWMVVAGPQGPQWAYKGWHLVFVRKGEAPGSAAHEGEDEMTWNTLKFVPPMPKLSAPDNVSAAIVDDGYALTARDGRLLFTGDCLAACAGWRPLVGGMASRGIGDWTVRRDGDAPQWLRAGKPVYVADGRELADLPEGGAVLRP